MSINFNPADFYSQDTPISVMEDITQELKELRKKCPEDMKWILNTKIAAELIYTN